MKITVKNSKMVTVHIVTFFIIISIIIFAGISITWYAVRNLSKDIVATVNGEQIHVDEYYRVLEKSRAKVYSYFYQKYKAQDSEDFWIKNYSGEIPVQMLREKTLEECKRIKVQQMLAKEKGVVESTDYPKFLRDWERENKRRQEAVRQGKVIYGPEVYSKSAYFEKVFSDMIISLKKELEKKELAASEEDLKNFFNTLYLNKLKKQDEVSVQKASISLVDGNTVMSAGRKQLAKLKMEEIRDQWKTMSSEELKNYYSKEAAFKIEFGEQVFNQSTADQDSEMFEALRAEAYRLSAAQISEIVESGFKLTVMKCTARKDNGYITYEEIKDKMFSLYVDCKYEEMVDSRVKEAVVKINSMFIEKISPR